MYLNSVIFIRRYIALILLLAWVPASSHCLLASALQDAVVDCCIEANQQQGSESHHDSGCCPFCGTFKSGKYLTPTKDKQEVGSESAVVVSLTHWLPLNPVDPSTPVFIPHASPLEAAIWQFKTRSARMGRSPNFSF